MLGGAKRGWIDIKEQDGGGGRGGGGREAGRLRLSSLSRRSSRSFLSETTRCFFHGKDGAQIPPTPLEGA